MKQPQLNTTSVYRRLSQISLSVVLLITVLNMWVNADSDGSYMQSETVSALTRQLTEQSALVAVRLMEKKQTDKLTLMLNDLVTNPYISQSVIFDKSGKLIAQSEGAISAIDAHYARYPLVQPDVEVTQSAQSDKPEPETEPEYGPKLIEPVVTVENGEVKQQAPEQEIIIEAEQPAELAPQGKVPPSKVYISEIRANNRLMGYLRINYLQHQALKKPLFMHKTNMRQIMLMLLLSGVIGFMLTRGFSRFSRNSFRVRT
ncbi:MAG: putative membrane protein affecting hemolysin expression [Phenylobacterium sp.]|jgi:uncharacterized membrane protein affecting hemolysin expression